MYLRSSITIYPDVCVCVCACVCVCVRVCVCVCVCVRMPIYIYIYVRYTQCIYVCLNGMDGRTYGCMDADMHVCLYACIHARVHVCVFRHPRIPPLTWRMLVHTSYQHRCICRLVFHLSQFLVHVCVRARVHCSLNPSEVWGFGPSGF